MSHQEVVYPILFEEPVLRTDLTTSELYTISKEGEGSLFGFPSNSMETRNYKNLLDVCLSSSNTIFEATEKSLELGEENLELKKENEELKEQTSMEKKKMDVLFEQIQVVRKENAETRKELMAEMQALKRELSDYKKENSDEIQALIREHAEEIQALRREHSEEIQALRREHSEEIQSLKKEVKKLNKMVIKLIPHYCEQLVSSTGNLLKKLLDNVGADYFTEQLISEGKHLSAPISLIEFNKFRVFAD